MPVPAQSFTGYDTQAFTQRMLLAEREKQNLVNNILGGVTSGAAMGNQIANRQEAAKQASLARELEKQQLDEMIRSHQANEGQATANSVLDTFREAGNQQMKREELEIQKKQLPLMMELLAAQAGNYRGNEAESRARAAAASNPEDRISNKLGAEILGNRQPGSGYLPLGIPEADRVGIEGALRQDAITGYQDLSKLKNENKLTYKNLPDVLNKITSISPQIVQDPNKQQALNELRSLISDNTSNAGASQIVFLSNLFNDMSRRPISGPYDINNLLQARDFARLGYGALGAMIPSLPWVGGEDNTIGADKEQQVLDALQQLVAEPKR